MAHSDQPDAGRRDFLYIASGAVGVVGVAAVVWPAVPSGRHPTRVTPGTPVPES